LAGEGGEVDRVEIGRIALQKIEPASFDLVRSDLRMLELTGMVLSTTRALVA
jgi:CheY-like chemotaxis protein